MYTIIILLKLWHKSSCISSSNLPLSHRYIQQLEDALNVSLCGHFLILLATMCIAAFSGVTVSITNLGVLLLKITVLWNVRLCIPEDVNSHTACTLRIEHLSIIFRHVCDNCVLLLSTRFQYQIAWEKLLSSQMLRFYDLNLGKCIDFT
jgi:hypothetical protein